MKRFFTTSIICLSLTACITAKPIPHEQRPQQWAKLVHSEYNFYQVSPWLYRSEQPDVLFIPLLKKYQIKTIINLRHTPKDMELLDSKQFNLVHLPIHTWQINREDLLQAMYHIQHAQRRGEKVLIHCYHGSDRTGATIAMYRIIFEHWSIEQATTEMKHGGYGFHLVWKNIEHLFTPENVAWIRQQLSNQTPPSHITSGKTFHQVQ